MGTVTTATGKMKVFLVSCFLSIIFFTQGWGGTKRYLVQTADDDAAKFEDENDDESLDDQATQGKVKGEDFNRIGTINARGSNVWNTQNSNGWGGGSDNYIGTINADGSNVWNTQNSNNRYPYRPYPPHPVPY